jgi:hypothetical protein
MNIARRAKSIVLSLGLAGIIVFAIANGYNASKVSADTSSNTDWKKVAWVPLQPPSNWKEWAWDPKKTGRTWKYVEELTPDEQKYWQIDTRWSHEIPRDKDYPLYPEKRYPFSYPYTGEELSALGDSGGGGPVMCGMQSHHGYHINRTKDRNGVVSKSDVICQTYKPYKTYGEYLYGYKPGHENGSFLVVIAAPSESAGTVVLSKFYKPGPGVSKVEDRWAYLPTLRRVRRINGASGEDYQQGSTSTYDDGFLRNFWEFDSKIIGVDILYQSANNKKPYGPITGPYRQDGGVECYVVLSKHYRKNYYLSQWVTWYEKKTLHPLRKEQWDRRGNFKQVGEAGLAGKVHYFGKLVYPWEEVIKGGLTPEGGERRSLLMNSGPAQMWDVELNVETYTLPDTPDTKVPYEQFGPLDVYVGGEDWKKLFEPQRIENSFPKPTPVVNFTAKDFPPHPPLYRDKFPKYRTVNLPADIQARIKNEEQNKRRLF